MEFRELLMGLVLVWVVAKVAGLGVQATLVALVGVVLPLALGFGVMRWFGHSTLLAVFVGETLTTTSVSPRSWRRASRSTRKPCVGGWSGSVWCHAAKSA